MVAQVTVFAGTEPFEVAGLNEQLTVSTTTPWGCRTRRVALVNCTSVLVSVQSGCGHPGAPGIDETGAAVVTLNATFPFLISLAGIASVPVRVTSAGACALEPSIISPSPPLQHRRGRRASLKAPDGAWGHVERRR